MTKTEINNDIIDLGFEFVEVEETKFAIIYRYSKGLLKINEYFYHHLKTRLVEVILDSHKLTLTTEEIKTLDKIINK